MTEKIRTTYYIEKRHRKLIKELSARLGIPQSEIVDCLFSMADNGIQDDLIDKITAKFLHRAQEKAKRLAKAKRKR